MSCSDEFPIIRHLEMNEFQISADKISSVREFAKESGTSQIIVMTAGELLLDEAFDSEPVDVAAVQKGIVSILIGIAEEKYLLEITDPVNHHLDPEWTNLSPWDEAKLTIEILLNMTTGMDDELNPLGTIGESWRYNNIAYNYLKKILCLHTGQTLNELSKEWLFEPLGMANTYWTDRASLLPDGTPVTALVSTAKDLSRIGLMVIDEGKIDGVEIVPSYFLNQLAQPVCAENLAWGLCWWNNNQEIFRLPFREETLRTGPITPSAPGDLIAARGANQNYLYIVPGLDLVVARTARLQEKGNRKPPFEAEFWKLLLA
jgi:CubicO group peptidase (beta-lactamase class C family)